MALINCPECGEKVSDTCECCIHCGYKLLSDSSNRETEKSEVVARRSEAGGRVSFIVFGFVCIGALMIFASALFVAWFILSDFLNANPLAQFICVIVQMVLWGFCAGGVVDGIIDLVKYKKNGSVQGDCIVYYGKNDKLLMTTLDNKKIAIKSSQFIKSSYGMRTSCLLVVWYRDERGEGCKATLGAISNYGQVKERLKEICSSE